MGSRREAHQAELAAGRRRQLRDPADARPLPICRLGGSGSDGATLVSGGPAHTGAKRRGSCSAAMPRFSSRTGRHAPRIVGAHRGYCFARMIRARRRRAHAAPRSRGRGEGIERGSAPSRRRSRLSSRTCAAAPWTGATAAMIVATAPLRVPRPGRRVEERDELLGRLEDLEARTVSSARNGGADVGLGGQNLQLRGRCGTPARGRGRRATGARWTRCSTRKQAAAELEGAGAAADPAGARGHARGRFWRHCERRSPGIRQHRAEASLEALGGAIPGPLGEQAGGTWKLADLEREEQGLW